VESQLSSVLFASRVALTVATFTTAGVVAAQSRAPVTSTARLLQLSDFSYVGAFRLPSAGANGDDFSFGGMPVAFNPGADSLFIGSHRGSVAEVTIPTPIGSAVVIELPVATYRQRFADPTEGHLSEIAANDVAIDGLLVSGGRLYGTAFIYYDALNSQTVSHYSRSLDLSERSFRGMYSVGEKGKTGFVSGYLAAVPSEWQASLGGVAITGQCCIPIVSRTSWGPAAFAWSPSNLGTSNPLPALPLLYYTGDHPTLGTWAGSSPAYGGTTSVGGVAIIAGTRTALFVGRNGTGPFCYGNGTSEKQLAGSRGLDGEVYSYDPVSSDKGQHAYPYNYQIWAYDLNDLAAVKAGRKKPWEPKPYGTWPLDLPVPAAVTQIGGVGYDPIRQRLYLSQMQADQDGYAYRPLIHVFQIN
jgi:hypothetical protein